MPFSSPPPLPLSPSNIRRVSPPRASIFIKCICFQVKKTVQSFGSSLLDDVTVDGVRDIIDIVTPFELMASKNEGNTFVGANFDKIEELTTVTEGDSPLRAALKGHIKKELNVVKILALIRKCKKVVNYFKTTGLNENLEGGTLKQEVETRWMSTLNLLKSFSPSEASSLSPDAKFTQVHSPPLT